MEQLETMLKLIKSNFRNKNHPISALTFGPGFRMGKTRPCEFFQIYRPISFILPPILSAQGDLHGEIPKNRFFVTTFDWSVLRTSGRPV